MQPSAPGQPPAAVPGWYPDPGGSGRSRYWDGARWTDALAPEGERAPEAARRDSARLWAVGAHLSALVSVAIGLPLVGPLLVYLIGPKEPYVRRHAAEALNFNLSFTIYGLVVGLVAVILIIVLVGLLLIPVLVALALAWVVLVIVASVKASHGEDYRYPLTIRFVSP